jgi:hypothetical protein
LVEDLQGFFASIEQSDVHIYELHVPFVEEENMIAS